MENVIIALRAEIEKQKERLHFYSEVLLPEARQALNDHIDELYLTIEILKNHSK